MDYREINSEMHSRKGGKYFPGFSLKAFLEPITALIEQHKTEILLDFGCGKARGYTERGYHDAWGGLMPTLYDIGVPEFSAKPEGQFGGVINTDMLEHIDEPDVPAMLDELIGYVEPGGFLFLGISCRPSKKKLPDGRSVHLTVKPPSWWTAQLEAAHSRAALKCRIVAHFDVAGHFAEPETPIELAPF